MPAPAALHGQGPLFAGAAIVLAALALCAAIGVLPGIAAAQPLPPASAPAAVPAAAPASAAGPASAAAKPASAASAPARRASAPRAAASRQANRHTTHPLWSELTDAQRLALAPLAPKWDSVSDAQKRKWIALSRNFPALSGAEQQKLHSRMTEWVALSPQQRTQARLNFGETQQLSPDDKRAKWEAYQALSPEEKRKLAARAAKPPATAAAVKPVPAQKLATVPDARKRDARPPRIVGGANQVDPNTLLPQQPAGPN